MAIHFTKRKTTRIIYFLLEVHNTIYEVFLSKIESLNATESLDLAINLQERQQIEHIHWHHGDEITKTQTSGSIKGQKKIKISQTKKQKQNLWRKWELQKLSMNTAFQLRDLTKLEGLLAAAA